MSVAASLTGVRYALLRSGNQKTETATKNERCCNSARCIGWLFSPLPDAVGLLGCKQLLGKQGSRAPRYTLVSIPAVAIVITWFSSFGVAQDVRAVAEPNVPATVPLLAHVNKASDLDSLRTNNC